MPKKVSAKKMAAKEKCCCGNCCGQTGEIESVVHIIFGGLVVALSFFLLQTMI
ncbi:MAG: hypothetical protein WC702_04095 [Patescibacteria group bacterium]|jgi:hypothetical protein